MKKGDFIVTNGGVVGKIDKIVNDAEVTVEISSGVIVRMYKNFVAEILDKNVGNALVELDGVLSQGKSPLVFSNDLISYFRDLILVYTLGDKSREIVVVKDDIYAQMKAQATEGHYTEMLKTIEVLSSVEQELRYSVQPRIVLETAIIKIINESF